jgi:23S rRNA (cytidine2498-2'-O)-methyltransferase
MSPEPLASCVYQAVPGFEDHLEKELNTAGADFQRIEGSPLFLANTPETTPVFWYQNRWIEPFRLEFDSIGEAASVMRNIQRNWAACLHTQFRRGSLIASKLPPLSGKPRSFPWPLPNVPVGAWTLLDKHTIIASARCASPFPNGVIAFAEDKHGPPSRAYLKLWEALTLLCRWPLSDERCIDAGASPGGWTWALACLNAKVSAVDRAPLEDRIGSLPNVDYIRHDAFTLKPEEIGPIDWLCCDVVCYPPRLFEWIENWLASGLCNNFVCTIKMQGSVDNGADFDTPRRFAALPGGKVVHLYHNKHELTWIKAG